MGPVIFFFRRRVVGILFVYANGVYHSPVKRLLLPRFVPSLRSSDTNAHKLISRRVTPGDGELLSRRNVSSDDFHTGQIAPRVTRNDSLVLYFRRRRHGRVTIVTPATTHGAFLVGSFTGVYICYGRRKCVKNGAQRRGLRSMVSGTDVVQPVVPSAGGIRSPVNGSFTMCRTTCGRVYGTLRAVTDTAT